MEERVVLVDKNDIEIGTLEKQKAHLKGKLHRAISVFIFNSKGDLLLQQRALSKYHSSGLWSNTCCTHPRKGESTEVAAKRRLFEEMGIKCDLSFKFSFIYKAELSNGLIEHEFDHVYFGESDNEPILNPLEAKNFKYENIYTLINNVKKNSTEYTEWFKICLDEVKNILNKNKMLNYDY